MAPRPRSYPALAVLLWIVLAICGLSAPGPAHATAGDDGTAAFGLAPDPWTSVAPTENLLADTEDEAAGDGLARGPRIHVFRTAFQPLTGRDRLGSPARFLIPFETGPPAT